MKVLSVFLTLCTILTVSRAVPVNSTLPWTPGRCEYERQHCRNLLGAYCPQCDSSGNFLPKQCSGSTGYCWCVNIFTGQEIPNTRTPPGTKPNCGGKKHCPDGWSSFGDKCFIFIDTPKKWTEAEVYCRFDGANLASIHSEEENHFITSLTRGYSHDFPQTWLGGFDAIQPGYWMWSDGSEFSYKNWDDHEQYKNRDDDDDDEKESDNGDDDEKDDDDDDDEKDVEEKHKKHHEEKYDKKYKKDDDNDHGNKEHKKDDDGDDDDDDDDDKKHKEENDDDDEDDEDKEHKKDDDDDNDDDDDDNDDDNNKKHKGQKKDNDDDDDDVDEDHDEDDNKKHKKDKDDDDDDDEDHDDEDDDEDHDDDDKKDEDDEDDDDDSNKKKKMLYCLRINYDYDLKWFYASCTDALPFVCAKKADDDD